MRNVIAIIIPKILIQNCMIQGESENQWYAIKFGDGKKNHGQSGSSGKLGRHLNWWWIIATNFLISSLINWLWTFYN
jgi:hypothetical protein